MHDRVLDRDPRHRRLPAGREQGHTLVKLSPHAGVGVTIYSSCVGNLPRLGVAVRPLRDVTNKLPVTAVWDRTNRSEVLETFLKFLRTQGRNSVPALP
ncbi:hypothetical protein [Paracoccus yeei]|uniref:hypothetical protein n=1 Tax=Paracoccus yeei TaxID=147645 RepID=UPI00157F9A6E|nr:hypothetical protein [Paracoccus yeei]